MKMLKRTFLLIILLISVLGCESDNNVQNNPNLLNIQFNIELNLNFPAYSQLNFPGNAIYEDGPGIGNDGIIVVNTGSGFLAWEASDPNMIPSGCSRLIIDGLTAANTCSDQYSYSLITGQALNEDLQYPLLNYRVTVSGNSVVVFN